MDRKEGRWQICSQHRNIMTCLDKETIRCNTWTQIFLAPYYCWTAWSYMGEDVASIITLLAQSEQQGLSSSICCTLFCFAGKEYSVTLICLTIPVKHWLLLSYLCWYTDPPKCYTVNVSALTDYFFPCKMAKHNYILKKNPKPEHFQAW